MALGAMRARFPITYLVNIVGLDEVPYLQTLSASLLLSLVLLVMEVSKPWIIHDHLIELLELVQRVLVVLRGTLSQDVHPEVGSGDLLLVFVLVLGCHRVSLALQPVLLTHKHKRTPSSAVTEYSNSNLRLVAK